MSQPQQCHSPQGWNTAQPQRMRVPAFNGTLHLSVECSRAKFALRSPQLPLKRRVPDQGWHRCPPAEESPPPAGTGRAGRAGLAPLTFSDYLCSLFPAPPPAIFPAAAECHLDRAELMSSILSLHPSPVVIEGLGSQLGYSESSKEFLGCYCGRDPSPIAGVWRGRATNSHQSVPDQAPFCHRRGCQRAWRGRKNVSSQAD